MSFRGVEFTPAMRKMVVNVKIFFTSQKEKSGNLSRPVIELTAAATGISVKAANTIISAYNKSGDEGLDWSKFEQRGRREYVIDSCVEPAVRQFIRHSNKAGEPVNVEKIRHFMRDELQCDVAHSTLWRALQRWGFEFGTGVRSAHLKESERIIIMRRQYLRQKKANRNDKGQLTRPEVYLDESYINKNHSNDHTWYLEKDGPFISKPTGKGERLIILNAITKEGWVPNSKLVFSASKKTGDYHANMNWDNFSRWFETQLLPNIPANSLIIMDNASYHNVLVEDAFPKKSHTVERLREWLSNNGYCWTPDMLKAELFELCARLAPKPEFLLDRMAREKGHSILRTPPYHPELQPIETCWAVVKNHVAQHNDCSMKKVQSLLEEGFEKVTAETCQKLIRKANLQEDAYWNEDGESLLN